MPKHIRRLVFILVLAAVAAIAARAWLTDPSFGRYGHYRADSVPDIAARQPLHQGAASCRQCHAARVGFWRHGAHRQVQCEICHTAAADHPSARRLPIPADTVALCSSCHAAMPARPSGVIRQVRIAEHMGDQACTECHNPHSPMRFRWEDIDESPYAEGEDHG